MADKVKLKSPYGRFKADTFVTIQNGERGTVTGKDNTGRLFVQFPNQICAYAVPAHWLENVT